MQSFHDQPRKRRAQLRHQPRSAPLWAGNEDDWAVVRHEPRPPLVCPDPGCDVELISYENPSKRYNPRVFKFKAGGRSCDHWADRGQGGCPEAAQHQWMKNRLASIVRQLGYTATPEHFPARADVFIHKPAYCLEVQLVATRFRNRTTARHAREARVCWMIREGLDTPEALRALSAVRFRVIDRDSPKGRPLAPWDDGGDPDLARRVRLQVFGTVARPRRADTRASLTTPGPGWFRTSSMDGYLFLQQVLSVHRAWYPPRALGHQSGMWALDTDVADYYAFRRRQHDLAARRSRLAHDQLAAQPASRDNSVPPSASLSGQARSCPEGAQSSPTMDQPGDGTPASVGSRHPSHAYPPAAAAAAVPVTRPRAWWRWRARPCR